MSDNQDLLFRRKFEALFREYFTGLCYFARQYTRDLDAAREVVHSVYIRIWENRLEFDWDKPAKSYLFTSVYNRSMNFIRDRRKFISHDEASAGNLLPDEADYSTGIETAELEGRIRQALSRLPGKCREVFELSRYEGRKYSEIAVQLNLSVKTVEAQMSKALGILREELREFLALILFILLKNHMGG